MITTNDTKARQDELFITGTVDRPVRDVLLITSCRGVPYLNYLVRANEMLNLRWRITFINPHELATGPNGEARDLAVELKAKQRDERVLRALREADYAFCESHYNFGVFNTAHCTAEGSIYQFGFRGTLCPIPNFHDIFLLAEDLVKHRGIDISDTASLKEEHEFQLRRFLRYCQWADRVDIYEFFKLGYQRIRLFHTFNHPSSAFTLEVFRVLNACRVGLELPDEFWVEAAKEDLFSTPQSVPTELDRKLFGIEWK